MTDGIRISIDIPQEIKDKLNPANFENAMQAGLQAAANEVKAEASWYPGPSHKPVIWANDNQRKFYFASRKGLPPNYTRQSDPMSQRMAKSWVVRENSSISFSVVQSATYAEYVIGEKQQPQHAATGWKKVSQIVADLNTSRKVQQIFEKVIMAFLRK